MRAAARGIPTGPPVRESLVEILTSFLPKLCPIALPSVIPKYERLTRIVMNPTRIILLIGIVAAVHDLEIGVPAPIVIVVQL